ncbi:hypothetical protein L7F22_028545 [Adiantum nelumboides]|nr:hypothetical protein [Adiantum nelumboides]
MHMRVILYQSSPTTTEKILQSGLWWPYLFRDAIAFAKQCDTCQRCAPKPSRLANRPLQVSMAWLPFERWDIDFVGPITPTAQPSGARYLLVATDYATKWAEVAPTKDCTSSYSGKIFVSKYFLQVTLHNQALFYMDLDPAAGFRKLNFLIQNPPFPPEAYRNLLLLYCKPSHRFTELASMLMADNEELTSKVLSQDLQDYLNAIIVGQTSIVESYQRLSELAVRYGEAMRRLTKQIQDTHISKDREGHRKALLSYENLLENYVPVIMAMAKVFWDKGNYTQVDRIFQQSTDFCLEHPIWRLNVAHNIFMQDDMYDDAVQYYEPIVKKSGDNILNAPAIVLANLCVSYIMTSRNEEAEDLMRKIEKEEERARYEDPEKQCLHLCIVNLVIGTLYCVKQNFEFGMSRIIKSLDPISSKLDSETWFYAKRCFLALADNLTKQMIMLRDSTYVDIDEFLDMVDLNSKKMFAYNVDFERSDLEDTRMQKVTISHEARLLKRIFLKCRD